MPSAPTRILLLEDNPSDRQFMNACLSDGARDLELDFVGRLAEASTHLREHRYEMVIADLNLPDTEGLDTFFKVKELAEDAAIVVMTGMDDPALASKAVLAGAQDYLVKGDLEPKRVRQSVDNALCRQDQLRRISGLAQDLRKKNSSLRELAFVDALSGMLNRRGMARALLNSVSARRAPAMRCALLLDVDNFSKVNELFGFAGGDQALKDIGRRLRALLRSGDLGARIGGDKFLVVASVDDASESLALAERMRAAVGEAEVSSQAGPFKVTASVGVALISRGPHTVENLLELTSAALKSCKDGGKNRVCVVGEPKHAGASKHMPSVTRVPFYELHSGKLVGHEFMAPDDLVMAEQGSTIAEQIGDLLGAAINGGEGLECHVRLTHVQLLQLLPGDLADVRELDPWRLKLCVPEVPMSPLPEGVLGAVRRLQAAGWSVGLHGLDLGPHAWANLILLEPAVVTLDPGMVAGAGQDPKRLRSLMRLSRALAGLGSYVVADGINAEADLKALDGLGIRYGSGSLWKEARP